MPEDESDEMSDVVFPFWREGREVCRLAASGSHLCCVVREGRGTKMRARGLLPMCLRLRLLRVPRRLGVLGKCRIQGCEWMLLNPGNRLYSAGYKYELDANDQI